MSTNDKEHGFYCQQNVTEIKQITRATLAFAIRMVLSVVCTTEEARTKRLTDTV